MEDLVVNVDWRMRVVAGDVEVERRGAMHQRSSFDGRLFNTGRDKGVKTRV